MKPEIILAKTAGFCFGVDRAVKMCNSLLDEGKQIVTLGPIIHNDSVVNQLKSRGCYPVEQPEDVPEGNLMVIRSHGVGPDITDRCNILGIETVDATCPFVERIHKLVNDAGRAGSYVIIAGDKNHPEVQGIVGHCCGEYSVVDSLDELKTAVESLPRDKKGIMVSQTTYNEKKYRTFSDFLGFLYTNFVIFATICSATSGRQGEAMTLSAECDLCVVIGGHNSSNTQKLREICMHNAPTICIENADELDPEVLRNREKIGVTAGASTPFPVIEEVLIKMSEFVNEVFDFEAELEESLKPVRRGQRVEGTVIEIKPNEVLVDIGRKHTGFVPVDELSSDPSAKVEDLVKIGETYLFKVIKVEDLEGKVTLSKKAVETETGMNDLVAAYESGEIVDAYITEVVSKGLVATVKGSRVFIPGSQATLRRGDSFDGLLHTHQSIKVIEADKERRKAIGSIRAVLEADNQKKADEFFADAEVGKEYTGVVKSLTNYGAFVDLGGVQGMIHVSEMSWKRIHHPSEVLKEGQEVNVFIKSIEKDAKGKDRVSLGYRREEDNPWNIIGNYELGTWFDGTVTSVVAKLGAFVSILPNVEGLLHMSEMAAERVDNPAEIVKVGDQVRVRLIGVDLEKQRISLSLLEEGVKEAAKAAAKEAKAAKAAKAEEKEEAAE